MTTVMPTATAMTSPQRESFERDGFLVVRGALSPAEVREFRLAATEAYRHERERGALGPDRGLRLPDATARVPGLAGLATHPSASGLAWDVLGWDGHLDHAHLEMYPQVRRADAARWHRHTGEEPTAGQTPPRAVAMTIVFWLSDASETGRGNLMVTPGSHRQGAAPVVRFYRDPDPPPPPGTVDVAATPGDLVLLHGGVWHARSTNYSPFVSTCVRLGYGCRAGAANPEPAPAVPTPTKSPTPTEQSTFTEQPLALAV